MHDLHRIVTRHAVHSSTARAAAVQGEHALQPALAPATQQLHNQAAPAATATIATAAAAAAATMHGNEGEALLLRMPPTWRVSSSLPREPSVASESAGAAKQEHTQCIGIV